MLARDTKRKRKEEGFNKVEDVTFQKYGYAHGAAAAHDDANWDHGYTTAPTADISASGFVNAATAAGITRMDDNFGYYYNQVRRHANFSVVANGNDEDDKGQWMLVKFKIASSGLLN